MLLEASQQRISLNEKLRTISVKIESIQKNAELSDSEKKETLQPVLKELQELRTQQMAHVKDSFEFMGSMSQMVNQ